MALRRDSRGDVVIAARLRDKEHRAEIEFLDNLTERYPHATVNEIIVKLIGAAMGRGFDVTIPYAEEHAREAIQRVDSRTARLEELVVKLLTVIKNGGVNVNQEPQFTVEDRDLLRNMERASRDGMGDLGEFDL
ncbi:MAG TPA: hypothetical protein PK607_17165 [Aggregatilineales bacterium]|jgi:hypothetical protein|nr:hypothetical protein [Aggregatilineales bacterium]